MRLNGILSRARNVWSRNSARDAEPSLRFDRPLLLFQSDDWGRLGVRDRQGWDELQAAGIQLGEAPYDFYSLETAEDLHALRAVLAKHHDSVDRHPSMVMNFIMANLDFDRCLASRGKEIPLIPLTDGLSGQWRRPHLFEAYRQGMEEGTFFPALHGLTHFCAKAVLRELQSGGACAELITKMWTAQTPYIYWRMPWIGYEYWDPELAPERRFLTLDEQRSPIQRAADIYQKFFASPPFSACAPGYRANADTMMAWFATGIHVVQKGPAARRAPYLDQQGMLHTFRTLEMEPAIAKCEVGQLLREVARCFNSGVPAVVSIHSINFHSTLQDFRTPTLVLLDAFLTAVEKKWPNLLYVQDADLFHIATEGSYLAQGKKIEVSATSMETKS